MELCKEILTEILSRADVQVSFTNLSIDADKIVEMECYKALRRIREILDDDTLEDSECFYKIEEIVCRFEEMGSDGGCRHDF